MSQPEKCLVQHNFRRIKRNLFSSTFLSVEDVCSRKKIVDVNPSGLAEVFKSRRNPADYPGHCESNQMNQVSSFLHRWLMKFMKCVEVLLQFQSMMRMRLKSKYNFHRKSLVNLETFTALNNTSAMLSMVPALLVVLCWVLSLPCALDCRIHRGHEEPHITTQVFDMHQLCLNGKQAAFLGNFLKIRDMSRLEMFNVSLYMYV